MASTRIVVYDFPNFPTSFVHSLRLVDSTFVAYARRVHSPHKYTYILLYKSNTSGAFEIIIYYIYINACTSEYILTTVYSHAHTSLCDCTINIREDFVVHVLQANKSHWSFPLSTLLYTHTHTPYVIDYTSPLHTQSSSDYPKLTQIIHAYCVGIYIICICIRTKRI